MTARASAVDRCIGRDRELDELEAIVAARGTALVRGPAGIGKSRLVAELARRVDGPVMWGRCWEAGLNSAYLPWIQLGAQLARLVDPAGGTLRLGEHLAPTFPHLSIATSENQTPPAVELLAVAWNEYLEEIAEQHAGALLVIEDIHRGDRETLTLLASLAGAGARLPIVATMRPHRHAGAADRLVIDEIERNCVALDLAGLADAEAIELLGSLVDVDAADRDAAIALAGGNPLYLRDLAAALANSGRLDVHGDLIARRVDSLEPRAGDALFAASVLADEFVVDTLAAMLAVDVTIAADALERLVDAGLLVRVTLDHRYRFVHDAYRTMTYEHLGAFERARWHARAFETLSAREPRSADETIKLATHAAMARPIIGAEPGVSWNVRAGEEALRTAAAASANTCFERALDLLVPTSDPALRDEVLLGLGRARALSGRTDAHDPLDEVLRGARKRGDTRIAVRAGLAGIPAVGPLAIKAEPDVQLVRRLQTSHAMAPETSVERARLSVGLAILDFTPDGIDALDGLLDEIDRIAAQRDDPMLRDWGLVARHTGQRVAGVDASTLAELDAAVARAPDFGDLHLSLWAVRLIMLLRLGRFSEASSHLARLRSVVDRVPGVVAWNLYRWLTTLDLVAGNYEIAGEHAALALQAGTAAGRGERAIEYFEVQLGAVIRDRGDDATDMVRGLVAREPSNTIVRSMAAWAIADCGDDDTAVALLRGLPTETFDDARMSLANTSVMCAMFVAGWTGQRDLAQRCLDVGMPYREEWSVLGNGLMVLGPAATHLGVAASGAGHHDLAMELLDAGRRRSLDAGSPPATAHASLEIARHLRRLGEPEAARWFRIAEGEFAALGSPRRAQQCAAAAADSTHSGRFGAVDVAAPVAATVSEPSVRSARLERRGRSWDVEFDGISGSVTHRQGLLAIATLVQRPDDTITAIALAAVLDGNGLDARSVDEMTLGQEGRGAEVLDEEAIASIRSRARDLQDEIDEADHDRDLGRADGARAELEALVDELERNVGLGGRSRRFADHAERARSRITKSIRAAISALHDEFPELARHLDVSIRTGTHCEYRPDSSRRIDWAVSTSDAR